MQRRLSAVRVAVGASLLAALLTGCAQGEPVPPVVSETKDPAAAQRIANLRTYFDGLARGTRRGYDGAIANSVVDSPAATFARHQKLMMQAARRSESQRSVSAAVLDPDRVEWETSASTNSDYANLTGFAFDQIGRLISWNVDGTPLAEVVGGIAQRTTADSYTVALQTGYVTAGGQFEVTFRVLGARGQMVQPQGYASAGSGRIRDVRAQPSYVETFPRRATPGWIVVPRTNSGEQWGGIAYFEAGYQTLMAVPAIKGEWKGITEEES